jgi:hypothetical protein
MKTSISYDARGKAFRAVALCDDGKVRAIKVNGARAQFSTSISGEISVSPAGVILFTARKGMA